MKNKGTLPKKSLRNIVIIIFVFLILCAILYIFIMEPIIYKLFLNRDIEINIEVYISEKYSEYDGGKEAENFLPKYEDLPTYNTIEFFYENNMNSIYGKRPDFFALDVRCDEDIYNKELEYAMSSNIDVEYFGDYEIYIIEVQENGIGCICFCENTFLVRYVYIHNYKRGNSVLDAFIYNCSLGWYSEK